MMRQIAGLIPLLVAAAGLVGCGGPDGPKSGAVPTPAAAGPKPGAKGPVEVTEVAFPGLDAALEEQKDNVVLVDFWATWCGPCVEKFPHLVELHKKYQPRGLTCMSVSMDREFAEQYQRDKVLAFLKEKGATFPNLIVADPDADKDRLRERFGKGAGIPFMALFNRAGNRVWDSHPTNPKGKLTDEQLEKLIEEELAK